MNDYERLINDGTPTAEQNLYQYDGHDLTSPELFFYLMTDETIKQTGIQDVYGVILILLGRPDIGTRGKFKYATPGTSVASIVCRALLDIDMPLRMPTLTGKTLSTLRVRWTTNLGAFVGRKIPYLGWAIGMYDVIVINTKTIVRYNSMVNPEDRINDATVGTLG
ncbi:STM2901 family protein [Burkholderia sp. 3C]